MASASVKGCKLLLMNVLLGHSIMMPVSQGLSKEMIPLDKETKREIKKRHQPGEQCPLYTVNHPTFPGPLGVYPAT